MRLHMVITQTTTFLYKIEVDDVINVNLHQETDSEWEEQQRDAASRRDEQQKQTYAQQQLDRGKEEQNCSQNKTFLSNNANLLFSN